MQALTFRRQSPRSGVRRIVATPVPRYPLPAPGLRTPASAARRTLPGPA
ncbi:hypothetical protein KPATCC21470_1965 [Kitasatospora purpeofusca]